MVPPRRGLARPSPPPTHGGGAEASARSIVWADECGGTVAETKAFAVAEKTSREMPEEMSSASGQRLYATAASNAPCRWPAARAASTASNPHTLPELTAASVGVGAFTGAYAA